MGWKSALQNAAVRWIGTCLIIVLCVATLTYFAPSVIRQYADRFAGKVTPIQTQGGKTVFTGSKPSALAKREAIGLARKATADRPVIHYKTKDLPREEQERIPVAEPVLGKDNTPLLPVLTAATAVPPHRGTTDVRCYLMPDGHTEMTLDPQREKFFGWDLRHLEVEGAYGIGGKQFELSAGWYPVRLGNVFIGARAETWTEMNGTFHGAATIRFRWEPFR